MGIPLGRGTMALWAIRLGGTFVVPLINLLNELALAETLIHCDETRLQVLKSDKSPTAIIGSGCELPDLPASGSCSLITIPRAEVPCRCDCWQGSRAYCSPTGTASR